MMIVGTPLSAVFFFLPVPPLDFFGVSTAVAVGVPAGVPGVASASPSAAGPALGFGALFFFAALAAFGALFKTWPRGPSRVCARVGMSSGSIIWRVCSSRGGVRVGGPYELGGMNGAPGIPAIGGRAIPRALNTGGCAPGSGGIDILGGTGTPGAPGNGGIEGCCGGGGGGAEAAAIVAIRWW